MRDKLIAEFSRIYWAENRKRGYPMTHEMADAAIAIMEAENRKDITVSAGGDAWSLDVQLAQPLQADDSLGRAP